MPRISRYNSRTNFHHVMIQGINKEYIFEKEKYIEQLKKIIINKLYDSNIKILAYCIMSNHAHFLIYSTKVEELSKFMQRVNTAYSMYYNNEKNRVGYVFRNRYNSQEIYSKRQLYICLKYIHNNPVKAKITKTMKDYKYSSYNEFLNSGEKAEDIIKKESIKILFGTSTNFKEEFNFIHSNKIFDIQNETIENFMKKVEKKYKINCKEIKDNKILLEIVIKEARKITNVKIVKLADILGISKSTVSNYLRK